MNAWQLRGPAAQVGLLQHAPSPPPLPARCMDMYIKTDIATCTHLQCKKNIQREVAATADYDFGTITPSRLEARSSSTTARRKKAAAHACC
eukprot:365578-Chlamydomonas_euryale.AAC.19